VEQSYPFFFTGLFLYGPQTLIGLYAVEIAPEGTSGTVSAVIGFVGNLGAILAGYPLSLVSQKLGWSSFHVVTLVVVIASILTSLFLQVPEKKKVN